jgi:VWFA-related protein
MPEKATATFRGRRWVVLVCFLFEGAAASQERIALVEDRVDVTIVNLDVVALGTDGANRPGLAREDFVVRIDGEQAGVSFFAEVRGGRWIAENDSAHPSVLRRNLLVFIDDWFPTRADRDETLRAFQGSLDRLGPSDFISLVAFDGATVERILDWSNELSQIEAAIETARHRPAYGMNLLGDRRHRLRGRHFEAIDEIEAGIASRNRASGLLSMDEAAGGTAAHQALRSAVGKGNRFESEVRLRELTVRLAEWLRASVAAVERAMHAASPAEGRSMLMLLAGGWPEHPAIYLLNNDHPLAIDWVASAEAGAHGGFDLLSPMARTANSLGYTVYPVDAVGRLFQPVRELQTANTLERLALDTGGIAFLDEERIHALAGVLRDSASYYSLGVSPPLPLRNGSREHEIRVEVLRPDVAKVRVARSGRHL